MDDTLVSGHGHSCPDRDEGGHWEVGKESGALSSLLPWSPRQPTGVLGQDVREQVPSFCPECDG